MQDFGQYALEYTPEDLSSVGWIWVAFKSSPHDPTVFYKGVVTATRTTTTRETGNGRYYRPRTTVRRTVETIRYLPVLKPLIVDDPNEPTDFMWQYEDQDPNYLGIPQNEWYDPNTTDPAMKALYIKINEDKT